MAQSVWHKHDIENVLRGVELTCLHMAAQFDGPDCDSYRRGFLAALAATATSFGIRVSAAPPPTFEPSSRPRRPQQIGPPHERD